MASIAILIGNANYSHQSQLECCQNDVKAMQGLLEATGKFDRIESHVDVDADQMRTIVRDALPVDEACDEVFFYFSGHGDSQGTEFYFCGTGYDPKKPNLTGVGHDELTTLFRCAQPKTLVSVIDACFSGAHLIKRDRPPHPVIAKESLRHVIQFSSSMVSQTSLAGDPLSEFTRSFLEASTRKTEGPVYYTDIAAGLRDEYLENDDQTPFFVNQGTGREMLVEDASLLSDYRDQFDAQYLAAADKVDNDGYDTADEGRMPRDLVVAAPRTPKELLEAAEADMGSPERMKEQIDALFDGLIRAFDASEFSDFFEKSIEYHSAYEESSIEDFMIRVLARESRPDRMVVAEIKNVKRKPNLMEQMGYGFTYLMSQFNNDFEERFVLRLNCSLERAQLKLTLKPKYRSLQQLTLVLSCAPSLKQLYVFERVTRQHHTDWDKFEADGIEAVRRWYTLSWNEDAAWLVDKIRDGLVSVTRNHLEQSLQMLSSD